MPSLEPGLIAAYNETRQIKGKQFICYAPFNNIYFNVLGEAAACWLTFFKAPRYPENSIHEIWFGDYFKNLRGLIRESDLSQTCQVCEKNIKNKLFKNPLARAYDVDVTPQSYPAVMEFELSNRCNLACTMCNGRLSSTIREARDQLPPLASPYDDRFIDQLDEFIPHLKEARFNGGEPFLQDFCWKAWERIIQINPAVEITVATNGTVWSDKVEKLLESGNFRINLSLDGMTAETYESIRVRSNFDRVIENVHRFGKYCKKKGSVFSIMINPMRTNWREMPLFVEFCDVNDYALWFNTVYRPFHLALWTLPSAELFAIHLELNEVAFSVAPTGGRRRAGLIQKYNNLVNGQILTWAREQAEREHKETDYSFLQRQKSGRQDELRARLISRYSDEKKFDLAWKKIEHLETRVAENVQPMDFYHILLQLPADWLCHELEHRSSEEMIENIYYRAEYY